MNQKKNDKNDVLKQVALFRFSLIAPLVNNCHAQKSNEDFFRSVASRKYILPLGKETTFAPTTIKHWYIQYLKKGFDGLIPKCRTDIGTSRAMPIKAIDKIYELKASLPHITGKAIYKKLVEDGILNYKDVSISSLYRFLKSNQLKHLPTVERRAFEMEFANDCWQCDTSHGPVINIEGKKQQTYLIQIIDDSSRVIVGNQFFLNDNSLNLQFVLKQAIKTYGIPKKIFVDNGTPYKNIQFQAICATIGSILIHSKPYSPESKGKIERSFRTIKDNFINCTNWDTFVSLIDLNNKYWHYINTEYNNNHHSAINTTPRMRFNQDHEKFKFVFSNEVLDEMFLHTITRKVATDSTIQLFNGLFEVPQKYIKQNITIKYSPDDLNIAYIYCLDKKSDIIYPLRKVDNSKVKRNSINYYAIADGGETI